MLEKLSFEAIKAATRQWKKSDWAVLGTVVLVTAALITLNRAK